MAEFKFYSSTSEQR